MFTILRRIVEVFNVLNDLRLGLLPCFVNLPFDFFALQVVIERLRERVVPAAASSAHARA